jgi:RsmE family RNA methyltransferase
VLKKNIQGNHGIVDGRELRHLRQVLRLAVGDRITVFDDTGWEHEAVIRSFGSKSAEIEIFRSYEAQRESPLDLTLALGLTKGDKMDFVVEKATEHGFYTVSLGRRILRAETAAVAALSIVQFLWGDLGQLSAGADR